MNDSGDLSSDTSQKRSRERGLFGMEKWSQSAESRDICLVPASLAVQNRVSQIPKVILKHSAPLFRKSKKIQKGLLGRSLVCD